jgi:diguanylate cyclase (GGDEF)-like protein
MQTLKQQIAWLLVLLWVALPSDARSTQKVLVLNSYHIQYDWASEQIRGIKAALSGIIETENLMVEFMDERRIIDQADYEKFLFDIYQYKYARLQPDIIISNDDFALLFLFKYHDQLFPNVPVVFNGVNARFDQELALRPLYTGIYEAEEIGGNLELMMRLQPEVKHLTVLTDRTSLGKRFTELAQVDIKKLQQQEKYKDKQFEILNNFSMEELRQKIANTDQKSAFLLVAIHADNQGKYFSFKDDLPELAQLAKVPVYGMWGTLILGTGAIGGLINDPYDHGFKTAKIAVEILNGASPSAIAISDRAEYLPRFDYQVLKRFHIDQALLPKDSQFINEPKTFYSTHTTMVHVALGVFLFLVGAIVLLLKNVRFRISHERKLQFLLRQDTLTKLPNRYALVSIIKELIAAAEVESGNIESKKVENNEIESAAIVKPGFSVFYLDVNNFKYLNDTLGRSYGDMTLVFLAKQLLQLQEKNLHIGRLGGDEFLIICPFINESQIEKIVKRIEHLAAKPPLVNGIQMQMQCAIGICRYPKDADTADKLIQYAETAMFVAKKKRENCFVIYESSLTDALVYRLKLERELRNAIGNNQLYFKFQPIVANKPQSGKYAEALLRWTHPELGEVPPQEFIPIAEQSGIIREINRWVIQQACLQLAKWKDQGREDIRLAINISSFNDYYDEIVETLSEEILRRHILPSNLTVEFTESIFLGTQDQIFDALKKLDQLGVCLAIDDFGTGFSNFSYLIQFPIDILKIDQSLLASVLTNENSRQVVKMIAAFAHQIGAEVVSEGVENEGIGEFMRGTESDYLQGYYFAMPMRVDEIGAFWETMNLDRGSGGAIMSAP